MIAPASNAKRKAVDSPAASVNVRRGERWTNVALGAGLIAAGAARRSWAGLAMAIGGGILLQRGNSGHCSVYQAWGVKGRAQRGLVIREQVLVAASPEEAYRYWRDFSNLPRFMAHLVEVTTSGQGRSLGVARVLGPLRAEWDAQIVDDQPNERIAWRSMPGSMIDTAGKVTFQAAAGDRGTEVRVRMEYRPPGGLLGETLARLASPMTRRQVLQDLERFKQLLESGQVTPDDVVAEASDESFPASDAPVWTSSSVGRPSTRPIL